jgi:hypothetical protein
MATFYFTQDQINVIQAFQSRGPNAQGNFSDFYAYVASILPSSSERRWFDGATQANAGQGAMSALIREYTVRQLLLRGLPASDMAMQTASNKVAIRVLEEILDPSRVQADGRWLAPSIDDIALNDATAVGDVLFQSLPAGNSCDLVRSARGVAAIAIPPGSGEPEVVTVARDAAREPHSCVARM